MNTPCAARWIAAICLALPLTGMASDQRPGWIGAPDARQAMQSCVPKASVDQLDRLQRLAPGSSLSIGHDEERRYIVALGDVWACVSLGDKGYAVVPRLALEKGILLNGVDEPTRDRFYRGLQDELAREGLARALVVQQNGKRALLFVSMQQGAAHSLMVEVRYVGPDEVKERDYANLVVDQPQAVVAVRSWGRDRAVPFLAGELAPRPLVGEYLQRAGNAVTATYALEGTEWRSTASPSVTIRFEAGGVLTRRSRTGASLGQWRRDGDIVYFHDRLVYHSAWLDGSFLRSETRRPAVAPNPAGANELQRRGQAETRGAAGFFLSSDEATLARLTKVWDSRVQQVKTGVEQQRQQQLAATTPDDGKARLWSLCTPGVWENTPIAEDLDPVGGKDICRSFVGTRLAWLDILRDGCRGRCLPGNMPFLDAR